MQGWRTVGEGRRSRRKRNSWRIFLQTASPPSIFPLPDSLWTRHTRFSNTRVLRHKHLGRFGFNRVVIEGGRGDRVSLFTMSAEGRRKVEKRGCLKTRTRTRTTIEEMGSPRRLLLRKGGLTTRLFLLQPRNGLI